jgi:hypothetical protein
MLDQGKDNKTSWGREGEKKGERKREEEKEGRREKEAKMTEILSIDDRYC